MICQNDAGKKKERKTYIHTHTEGEREREREKERKKVRGRKMPHTGHVFSGCELFLNIEPVAYLLEYPSARPTAYKMIDIYPDNEHTTYIKMKVEMYGRLRSLPP